jgi:hypothetical protein
MIVPRSKAHMQSLLQRFARRTTVTTAAGGAGTTTSGVAGSSALAIDHRYFHIIPGVYGVKGTTLRVDTPISWQPMSSSNPMLRGRFVALDGGKWFVTSAGTRTR